MSSSAASQWSTDTNQYYNYSSPTYQPYNNFLDFITFGTYNKHIDNENAIAETNYNKNSQAAASALDQDRIDKARDYDIWFDSTKYQRAVSDLKAAGLNPWLAVQSGINGSGSTSAGTNNSSSSAKAVSSSSSKSTGKQANIVTSALKFLIMAAILG